MMDGELGLMRIVTKGWRIVTRGRRNVTEECAVRRKSITVLKLEYKK